jgi:membrane protein required for colicin V production
MPEFTWIDWVVLGVIACSTLLSLLRGLVQEVASLAIWALAIVAASRLAYLPVDLLPDWMTLPIKQTISFVLILVLVLVLGKLVTLLLRQVIQAVGVGFFDRLLGTAFGFARGGVIVVVLAILASMTALPTEPAWQKAKSKVLLELGIRTAAPWLPDFVHDRVRVPVTKDISSQRSI